MERDRGALLQAMPADRAEQLLAIPASRSTPLLRRCTALATRARVDLLIVSRPAEVDELAGVLAELGSWEGAHLSDPDPTMLALAAAALQDLDERLEGPQEMALGGEIARALEVLQTAMARALDFPSE